MSEKPSWQPRESETADEYCARQAAETLAYHRLYGHRYCEQCGCMIGCGFGTCQCGPKYQRPVSY